MKFLTTSFPGEDISYITPSWEEMNQLAFQVAQKIIKDKKQFNRIITLAKGGWSMTRSMVDFLSLNQVASVGVKFYSGINEQMEKPHIYQDLPEKIRGEKILLFDDVADTGHSLKFTKKHLLDNGAAAVTLATLFYKPHSLIKPDYYAATTSAWIIFPYEIIESVKILQKNWQKQGLSQAQISQRFKKLHFPPAWIKLQNHA